MLDRVEPISPEELQALDERLVLSRTDQYQWRTVSMDEYARLRAYIKKLENQCESELFDQLILRENRITELVGFFSHFFDSADQIIMGLKDELSTIRDGIDRIQISEGYLGRYHHNR